MTAIPPLYRTVKSMLRLKNTSQQAYGVTLKTATITTADKEFIFPDTNVSTVTGTGALVLGTAPTFTTSITTPLVIAASAFELRTNTTVSAINATATGACAIGPTASAGVNGVIQKINIGDQGENLGIPDIGSMTFANAATTTSWPTFASRSSDANNVAMGLYAYSHDTNNIADMTFNVRDETTGARHSTLTNKAFEWNSYTTSLASTTRAGAWTFPVSVDVSGTTASTSKTTGALKTAGGLGVAKAVFAGGPLYCGNNAANNASYGTVSCKDFTLPGTGSSSTPVNMGIINGLIVVREEALGNYVGLFMISSSGVALVSDPAVTVYSTTATTANRINIYYSGGNIYGENKVTAGDETIVVTYVCSGNYIFS